MKTKLRYILFSFCLVFFVSFARLSAQTNVSGGIYANTTWTLVNSPYIVTGQITLFPSVTLTIQPGVVVKFNNGTGMEIRGSLMAVGTITDSILFTSSSTTPTQGIWQTIFINTNVGGSAQFKYSIFKYAQEAVQSACCWGGGPLTIRNSRFYDNFTAASSYAGWVEIIDSCYFSNNFVTITAADKKITNSTFVNNYYGLYMTERIEVINCNFCGNHVGLYGGRQNLQNSVIMNNGVGVKSFFEGFTNVSGNIIARNDTGIILGDYSNGSPGLGTNNKICSNHIYNLINNTPLNIATPNNCWCESNPTLISQKIYDGYDNINLGLINFSPTLVCDTTQLPQAPCNNATAVGITSLSLENSFELFPNPMQEYSVLKVSRDLHNAEISVIDLTGQIVLDLKDQNGSSFTLLRQNLSEGLYIIHISEQQKNICNLKLLVL